MVRSAWFKSLGRSNVLTAFGLIITALTGASLYAIDNGAAVSHGPSEQSNHSSDVKSLSAAPQGGSTGDAQSSSSGTAGSSNSNTSTSTNTSSVNGKTSTQVTVNGKPIAVPVNGTTQQTTVSGNQKTTVTVSGSTSGTASSTSVSSTSVQVSNDSGGDVSGSE
jgi:cytoskeletal protein RodZ